MTESVISSVRDELSSLDSLSASSLVSLLIREILKNFFHHVGHASHQSCFCDDSQMLSMLPNAAEAHSHASSSAKRMRNPPTSVLTPPSS